MLNGSRNSLINTHCRLITKLTPSLIYAEVVVSTQGKVDATTEELNFNIMFKYPDGREVSIGETLGLSSCKKTALEHMIDEGLLMKEGWGYTCCTIEEGSSCHRKIQ